MTAPSPVRVLPPDSSWGDMFRAESVRIHACFPLNSVEVHHIGSTAICGIYAKPVIDILLLVADLSIVVEQTPALESLGYEAKGEFGISERRYFRRDAPNGIRTHQIHAFVQSSEHAHRHLAFRDYMNARPEIAREYSELKQRLAREFPHDMEAYMDGKDAFIKHHQALALNRYAAA